MKKAPVEGRKQEKVGLFLCSLHLILKSNSLHIDISSTSSCLAGKYNLYMQFMGENSNMCFQEGIFGH